MNQFLLQLYLPLGPDFQQHLEFAADTDSMYGERLVLGLSVSQERAKCARFSMLFKNLSLHLFETQ